jgi:hypothetical protein
MPPHAHSLRGLMVTERMGMGTSEFDPIAGERRPWNGGRKVGAKRALKPQQVWAIRFFLDQHQ